MITLDTSGLFALLNRRDPDHEDAKTALAGDPGPYLVPAGILGEMTYLVEDRLGAAALDLLLADLEEGAYTLDCGEGDLPRIRELVGRYANLPLGFCDAATIACAERSGGHVLTFDHPDFATVAREGRIEIVPGW